LQFFYEEFKSGGEEPSTAKIYITNDKALFKSKISEKPLSYGTFSNGEGFEVTVIDVIEIYDRIFSIFSMSEKKVELKEGNEKFTLELNKLTEFQGLHFFFGKLDLIPKGIYYTVQEFI